MSARPSTMEAPAGDTTRPGHAAAPPAWPTLFPLVLILALFALVYAGDLGRGRMLGWDESEYAGIGRGMLRGEGYQTYGRPEAMRLPMVPLLVAATLAVAPHAGDTGLRVTGLLGMLAVIAATWLAVARATDRATAAAAALLLGAMPMIQVLATLVLSEAPFLLWFSVAVWAFHDGLEGRSRSFLACGAAVGLAALTRYVAWLFVPVAALMLLARLSTLRPRELVRRTIGTRAFRFAPLVALLVLAPWLLRSMLVFGDPIEGPRESLSSASTWGIEPWSGYLTQLPLTAGWPVLIAGALGVVVAARERGSAAMTALIAGVVVTAAHSRWAHKEDRYISAALPFLATLAAIGLARAARSLLARSLAARFAPFAAPALAIAIAVAALGSDAKRRLEIDPAGYPILLQALDTVRDSSAPGQIVIGASGPLIRWHADRPVRPFPDRLDDLPAALGPAAWVVFVNFERMQPDWAAGLTDRLTTGDALRGDVKAFRDGAFRVVIARASTLAARHAAGGSSTGR